MKEQRIQFQEIEATNFLSYPHFKVNLSNQGFVLLSGFNGAGKTSICNAIDYAIYSTTTLKLTPNEMINIHSEKDFWVKLKFKKDGIEYVIEHFRKHDVEKDNIKVFRSGELITSHLSKPDIKKFIPSLVMDRTSFLSTVYLSQRHNHIMINGTPKEKERYLMWLFGLNFYEDMMEEASKYKNKIAQSIEDEHRLQEEIKDIQLQIKQLPTKKQITDRINETKEKSIRINAELSVLEDRLSKLTDLKAKLEIKESLVSQIKEVGITFVPTFSEIKSLQKSVESLQETIFELKSELKETLKAQQIKKELDSYLETEDPWQLQEKLEKEQAKKTILIKVEREAAEKAKSLRRQLSKINPPNRKIDDLEGELSTVNVSIDKLTKKISNLSSQIKKGICPTCKRPWELSEQEIEEIKQEVVDSRGKLDDLNKRKYVLKVEIEQSEKYSSIQEQLSKISTNKDPQEVEQEILKVTRLIKNISSDLVISQRRKQLEDLVKNTSNKNPADIEKTIFELSERLKEESIRLKKSIRGKALLDQIAKLPDGDFEQTVLDVEETKKVLSNLRKEEEGCVLGVYNLNDKLKKLKSLKKELLSVEERYEKSKKASKDSSLLTIVKDGFGQLLRNRERVILDELTKKIPGHMKTMFSHQNNWIKAKLCKEEGGIDLKLTSMDRPLPQKGLSPGQQTKLGLACVFAIRDLHDVGCNILILDEPLPGVDEKGIIGFTDILKNLRSKIETLIIISHEPEIKGLNFDKVWTATISEGKSKLLTE